MMENMQKFNKVKIDKGLYVDSTRIEGLTDVKISSSVEKISEVTIKFFCKVDGLDNILEPYLFNNDPEASERKNIKL